MYFNVGEYDENTATGLQLIGHELQHIQDEIDQTLPIYCFCYGYHYVSNLIIAPDAYGGDWFPGLYIAYAAIPTEVRGRATGARIFKDMLAKGYPRR
jgi:hypothetical protein